MEIRKFFGLAVESSASDVIFTAGVPPALRVNGEILYTNAAPLEPAQVQKLAYSVLSAEEIAAFERELEMDFSFTLNNEIRFRGNLYRQKGAVAAAFRLIPGRIPSLEELRLPPILKEFALTPQGLILATGPTGHGKSTTQAAMIEIINAQRRAHIITIEDPIEFLHRSSKSIIDQREVGSDTRSFSAALKHVLRENPDVILIGEMRDLETIATALTAAETGHLVISTLHTNDSVQTIDRLIDVFPPHQQNQIRTQLSFVLLVVVAQKLLPLADGRGRVVATEVMRNIPAVANLIRENKTQQIATVLETQARFGMHTMDSSLKELYRRGLVTREEAERHMRNPQLLKGA